MPRHQTPPFSLVGHGLHAFAPCDRCSQQHLTWQGQIVAMVYDEYYVVQLLSWFSGDPTHRKLLRLADTSGWVFYPDEAMYAAFTEHSGSSDSCAF